jgi:type III secretion protein J
VQILKRRNLPPQQFDGLGSVFRKDSLVSTLTEERARLIYAMSRELERTLYEIDGVIVARVHPVIPPHDPLNPKKVASSAAVLVKYRPGAEVAGKEAMVRSLVAAGIEGLSYDDVRVHLVAAEAQPIVPDAPSVSRALPPMFWGILGVLVGLLLLSYFALTWRNRATVGLDELRGRLLRQGKRAASPSPGKGSSK